MNRDLADVLGNFVNRILKFCETPVRGRRAGRAASRGRWSRSSTPTSSAQLADLTAQFEAIEMRKAAQALRALWVLGNEYLQEAAPWTAIKTDPRPRPRWWCARR